MRTKTKNLILSIVVSIITISIPAFLFNKWIEAITFFVCHWLIRQQFKKQYHHIVPAMCRLITGIVFFFGVSFILPLGLSLFSALPINYLIGWVGFTKKQADFYEVKYNRLKSKLEQKKEFNVETCTKQELIDRCNELHFSKENIELAIELFIDKASRKELANKYCIELESIKKKKQRMKLKLNSGEK